MYKYWLYYDTQSCTCYYTESSSMSVSSFAAEVSYLLRRDISASDTSACHRESDLNRYLYLRHI